MLDPLARRMIDPPLNAAGRRLAALGVSANQITIAGFVIGLGAVPLLAVQAYSWALLLIAINRLSDGLDGAVARHEGATDLGGYLDIVCDFIFYAAVVFGFGLGRPEHAIYAAFLLFTFMGTGSTFLAFAAIAARRGLTTESRGRKSIYYLGGLAEGTETVSAFVLFCLLPDWFPLLASVFGAMCLITSASRIVTAWQTLAAD